MSYCVSQKIKRGTGKMKYTSLSICMHMIVIKGGGETQMESRTIVKSSLNFAVSL